MQNIDEELQDCLRSMIESVKNTYFKDNSGGFFLGGSQGENSPGWYWHNGDQIEVRQRYLALSIKLQQCTVSLMECNNFMLQGTAA